MSEYPYLYLKVVGEPFLSFCQDWQKRYYTYMRACQELAEKWGATGFFTGSLDGTITGLVPVDPVPKGWKLYQKRASDRLRMIPIKGHDPYKDLPPRPTMREVQAITGIPTNLSYEYSEDHYGSRGVGNVFFEFQLLWLSTDLFVILAPDFNAELEKEKKDHPGAKLTPGEPWVMPEGLERITKARWDLMLAQHRVNEEEAT